MEKEEKMSSEGTCKVAEEPINKSNPSIDNSHIDNVSPLKKEDLDRANSKSVMAAPSELSIASSEVRIGKKRSSNHLYAVSRSPVR